MDQPKMYQIFLKSLQNSPLMAELSQYELNSLKKQYLHSSPIEIKRAIDLIFRSDSEYNKKTNKLNAITEQLQQKIGEAKADVRNTKLKSNNKIETQTRRNEENELDNLLKQLN